MPAFENLTAEPGLEAAGAALAELAAEGMLGHPRAHPLRVAQLADSRTLRATHLLHGWLERRGGKLRAVAVLEDLRRLRAVGRAVAEASSESGLGSVADALLSALGLRARSVAQRNWEAVRLYAEVRSGAASPDVLSRAAELDPGFGALWIHLAQVSAARADAAAARTVVDTALERGALDAVDRARLRALRAALEKESEGYLTALQDLAAATPADPDVFQQLAVRRLLAHRYLDAAQAYQAAAERDPENPVLLNETGYAWAYAGRAELALAVLARYRSLLPGDPNPADSLGDVYFQFGRFAEADRAYLESAAKSADFAGGASLLKAAYARLLRGDAAGAEETFRQFQQVRNKVGDPLVGVRTADWEFVAGRRLRARESLAGWARAAGRAPEERVLAYTRLAIWSLDSGDRVAGRDWARQAVAAGGNARARAAARLAQWLAQAQGDASQLRREADALFGADFPDSVRRMAVAYALLLAGRFRDAEPILAELERETPPAPYEPVAFLLGWAKLEAGLDPGDLLERWPPPRVEIEPLLPALVYPRVIFLRAWRLQRQGRGEAARELYSLYLKYAGDRPSVFGEKQRAEDALRGRWAGSVQR